MLIFTDSTKLHPHDYTELSFFRMSGDTDQRFGPVRRVVLQLTVTFQHAEGCYEVAAVPIIRLLSLLVSLVPRIVGDRRSDPICWSIVDFRVSVGVVEERHATEVLVMRRSFGTAVRSVSQPGVVETVQYGIAAVLWTGHLMDTPTFSQFFPSVAHWSLFQLDSVNTC
jgi:hypothetical protein